MPDGPAKNSGKYISLNGDANWQVTLRLNLIDTTEGNYSLFANVSLKTRLDTRSIGRRQIKVGIRGRKGRKRAEARTLLVYVAHRLTLCNVSLMSRSLLKGVYNAARQPGGSPVEAGSLTASRLPLFIFGASLWTKVLKGLRRVKRITRHGQRYSNGSYDLKKGNFYEKKNSMSLFSNIFSWIITCAYE